MKLRYGIEHEVAFQRPDGRFADFTNTVFEEFERIVATLPLFVGDYPQLRIGDAGIKRKRWYIEGFERFDEAGALTGCIPKGIEIRTTIHASIDSAVAELRANYNALRNGAASFGFTPVLVSYNPFQPAFQPHPPLNRFESRRRMASPEKQSAYIPMMTQGPDLNISMEGMSVADLIDFGCKLTYYSPFIVPFSFSAPFFSGKLWGGYSRRTYLRTGARPAAMVFLENGNDLIQQTPSLTKIARLAAEVGRIEFKACDSCSDFDRYGSLLALMKGLLFDTTLPWKKIYPGSSLT